VVTRDYTVPMKEIEKIRVQSESAEKPMVLRDTADVALGSVVTVRDAKSHLSSLLDWVARGREVTITSDGRPKARLVPVSTEKPRPVFAGMGDFLTRQPIHGGPTAEEVIREDRDGRGW
jgi:prevent-host-death family protein